MADNDPTNPPPSNQGNTQGDPAAAFQRLLERHQNDATALSRQLYEENYRYRDQIRDLTGRVPAEGAVVLAGDDATAWAAYRQLGAVADIQAGLAARDTSAQELATLRQDLLLRDVADLHKFDADVLRTLANGLTIEIREVENGGKKERKAFVIANDTATPIEQHAQAQWSKFLPSLKLQEQRPAIGTPRTQQQQAQQGAQPPRKSTVRL